MILHDEMNGKPIKREVPDHHYCGCNFCKMLKTCGLMLSNYDKERLGFR